MTTASPQKSRPLSPHLGSYKPQISSVMSILHRVSGIGLALALPFFVLWLVVLAGGKESYDYFLGSLHSILGHCAIYAAVFLILTCVLTTAVKSIFHPSGFAKGLLCFAAIVVAAAATGLLAYYIGVQFALSPLAYKIFWYVGEVVLVGWTWAFFYHFCCGIRHLLWDAGLFLTLRGMHVTGWIVILISTVLTAAPWLHIWGYI